MNKRTRAEYNQFIIDTVHTLKQENDFSWNKVAKIVFEEYPTHKTSKEGIRSAYRYNVNKSGFRDKQIRSKTKDNFERAGIDNIRKQILVALKRKNEVNYLANKFGLDIEQLLTQISKLELEGFVIDKWKENGKSFVKLGTDSRYMRDFNVLDLEAEDEISILVIGDTHIGHKKSQIGFMQQVIEDAYDKGVRTVLHSGDVTEGHYQSIRPTSIRELDAIGFDEQLELAYNVIPKLDGLHYYMISGNHDESFDRNAFANPVKTLAKMREDITYLGHNFAKVNLNDKVDMVLVHPTDGIGQNYALKLKQYIDRNKSERLGRFIFMGHYHKFTHMHYMGIDAWVLPALVGQSEFMTHKNLESVVGAMILTIKLDKNGEVITFIPEYYFLD